MGVSMFEQCVPQCVLRYRLVAYPDDIGDGPGSAVFHDDPQVAVLKVAAVVSHYMRAENTAFCSLKSCVTVTRYSVRKSG